MKDEDEPLPEGVNSLLRLNRENSMSQAARLKIIKNHFSGDNIDMQPFLGMKLEVWPHAAAWMARDCDNDAEGTWGEGFELLTHFAFSMMPMKREN